jgi:hypothetical protein
VTPDGAGRLRVTVSANAVREIRFGPTSNALIDMAGHPSGRSGTYSATLPGGTQQATFHVRRSSAGATTVPMTVVDACGEWKTFVGGGASAF